MGSGEVITIEYEFTREDYVRWTGMLQEKARTGTRWRRFYERRTTTRVVAVLMTLAPVYLLYRNWTDIIDRGNHFLGGVILSVGAGAAGMWWHLGQWKKRYGDGGLRRAIEDSADSEEGRLWQGHKRVTVAPSFLVWEANQGVFMHRWGFVREASKAEGFLHLDFGALSKWAIPLRAFADEAATDRFIALVNAYRAGAPGGERGDVRDLLAERDVKCPGCGYNLRGSAGEKCPECGRGVGIGDVLRRG